MPDIIFQANRCLKCKNPSYQKGCPVQTDIPNIIKMFLDGKIEEAGKKLFDNNPLSVFCSMICPHENNCMGHCVLNKAYKIECSFVIIAIGQGALSNIVNNTKNIGTKEKSLVVTTATEKQLD